MKQEKRNNEIVDLKKKGVPIAKIARLYKLSRTRIYQIIEAVDKSLLTE